MQTVREISTMKLVKISPAKSIYGLLLTVILFSGCAPEKSADANISQPNSNQTFNSNNETIVQDDRETLAKIINLPFAPEETTYAETVQNGRKIVAVVKFSPADAEKIVAAAEKYQTPVAADVYAENWFPPELVARTQQTGDESLKGVEYAAADFFQPPYSKGKITRINETDYFVLELNAL